MSSYVQVQIILKVNNLIDILYLSNLKDNLFDHTMKKFIMVMSPPKVFYSAYGRYGLGRTSFQLEKGHGKGVRLNLWVCFYFLIMYIKFEHV